MKVFDLVLATSSVIIIRQIFVPLSKDIKMKSAILTTGSGKSFQLLLDLAKELGIKTKVLSEEQMEDAGLCKAMKEGRTGKYVNTEKFLKTLK
jgi:hypothetical protein